MFFILLLLKALYFRKIMCYNESVNNYVLWETIIMFRNGAMYEKRAEYKTSPWLGKMIPFKIVEGVYFVGTYQASCHLIDTGDGLILIDPGYMATAYLVLDSIYQLGFDPRNIKYIVNTHWHRDHTEATAALANISGAKTLLGKDDVEKAKNFFVPDILIGDEDTLALGNTTIRFIHTPGHTKGTISFFFDAVENGRTYRVGSFGGAGLNTLEKGKFDFDGCREAYLASIERLKNERVDIFIGNHTWNNATYEKSLTLLETGRNEFIDEALWQSFLESYKVRLLTMIENEAESKKEDALAHTMPSNEHEAAVIARARQLTDFRWTPVRDIPTYTRAGGQTVLSAGVEITGFPYSSTEEGDKFFTENVSIETFLSAISNPHSKIYGAGRGAYHACSYGIVCNGLVRYAFGIPYRVSTARWGTISDMREVKPQGEYTVEEIRLCDVLYVFCEKRSHVSLITDIVRDSDGKIVKIEVSEAIRPLCTRRYFTPEKFLEAHAYCALYRYDKLNEVPLLDEETDRLLWQSEIHRTLPAITVDNGNRSNYLVGEEVLISVFGDQPDTVELLLNGELYKSYPVNKKAMFSLKLPRGYYVARLKEEKSSVEFCVNQADVRHEIHDGCITVFADPCDEKSEIHYMDFRQTGVTCASLEKYEVLSPEEKQSGTITRPIPERAGNFKVYYKNAYGIWTHPMTAL